MAAAQEGDVAPAEPIPGTLNLALALAAPAAALGLLAFASRTPSWGWRIAAAVAFSYVNNTIFSLLHEAVHGHFHPRRAGFAATLPGG